MTYAGDKCLFRNGAVTCVRKISKKGLVLKHQETFGQIMDHGYNCETKKKILRKTEAKKR